MEQLLRFHWSLSQAGNTFRRAQATAQQTGLPNLEAQLAVCRQAEVSGIESMLMAIGFSRPDPLLLTIRLGMATDRMHFMVACRSGLVSPSFFVQQVNTISAVLQGRISINIVCGHSPHELRYYGDFLSHDERYQRTDEFWAICQGLWQATEPVNFEGRYFQIADGQLRTPFVSPRRDRPEIFLAGNSPLAAQLAVKYADCLWCFADAPQRLGPRIAAVLQSGTEVGLLVSLIARPSRGEALSAAEHLIGHFDPAVKDVHRQFATRSDSVGFRATYALGEQEDSPWLTPCLWTGAVAYLGAPAIALVGSYEELATAIMDYKQLGISQFLFCGWPDFDEMARFGRHLLPLIRAKEATCVRSQAAAPLGSSAFFLARR